MPLSWNEIKARATAFSKDWEHTQREDADAKPFLDAFFNVFDVSRKKTGTFEHKVKKLNDTDGYIDLLWKGVIMVEMKSRGKDLNKAFSQAKEYAQTLAEHELPKYILVCDFNSFKLYDTEEQTTHEFLLKDFVKHVGLFGFISGYQKKIYKEQDPANIDAALRMGRLHDRLEEIGYSGHALEVYLVRILFCLFAEDTTIFNKQQFQDYIEQRTATDGSDLAARLQELFQVLNTPADNRFTNLDEQLAEFPYVNGKLFEETLPTASFDSSMRQALLHCCYMDWSRISPAIFGSMFQSIMNPKERRNLGAHYTSEKNILKLIKPLFLDGLWAEFEKVKRSPGALRKLHEKISRLRFLDPACGCGNFLIIAYRELRLLEIEIIKLALKGKLRTDIDEYYLLDVDKFYGIEYEEFPAQIAQVAMWLIDHQMNMEASQTFGSYYRRLPLRKSATIVHGNALRIDWQSLLQKESTVTIHAETANVFLLNEPSESYGTVNIYAKNINLNPELASSNTSLSFDFILGNPPFVGKQYQTKNQKEDLAVLMSNLIKGYTDLDYVTGWFYKASEYTGKYQTNVAFVSTSSITQGEQVPILWATLLNHFKIHINFAHKTFKWRNEAKGVAGVHCIIIGFSIIDNRVKKIFEYDSPVSEPHEVIVDRINPYLSSGPIVIVAKKNEPICSVPTMRYGNKPTDDGNFIFTNEQKIAFLKEEPMAEKYFKPFTGSEEFLHGNYRWCLWLKDANPSELKIMPKVLERINAVRLFREKSSAEPTRKAALTPSLFFYISQPNSDYLLIPETSSENRAYIPIGYVSKETIASNAVYLIPDAGKFIFGVLISKMHMAWMRYTCGRLESRYRYTGSIVYNNFPWPENPTGKQKEAVEKAAQAVLDVRLQFPNSSLADLYDPNTMPPTLVKAHQQLDKAVDLCYRPQPFINETKRIEFLFELYDKYTAGLFVKEKKGRKNKRVQ